jgi:hypothetical protein
MIKIKEQKNLRSVVGAFFGKSSNSCQELTTPVTSVF